MSFAALYRAYLRQIRNLPIPYLRHFFRIRAIDCVRSLAGTNDSLRHQKIRRILKEIGKISAATAGNTKAFGHILDLAYGRKGRLKRELMEPFLTDSKMPVHPRIIGPVNNSYPPFYSIQLQALLTSSLARKSKPLTLQNLCFPPTLPSQANPTSEEARLFGPFSKRREVNIRWRYFTTEWKKLYPPLIVLGTKEHSHFLGENSPGCKELPLQRRRVHEDAERIVGPVLKIKSLTRKETQATSFASALPRPSERHPSRWLRRRFQELLGRTPILSFSENFSGAGKYSIVLSENVLEPSLRFSSHRRSEVNTLADLNWLGLAVSQGLKRPN